MRKDGKYLITGGSGYLGQELIRRLIKDGYMKLIVVARNEGNLLELKAKFPSVEIVPGDISDALICGKVCKGVTGIFHLAAFKHVRMAEDHTWQCVKSNIIGTLNLLKESLKVKPESFVYISTDKAAQIKGVYGATKYIGEKLVQEFAEMNSDTRYVSVRYGNVWGSTGSIITKWRPLIESRKPIFITEPRATRFFFTVGDAVNLIFKALKSGKGATPQCPQIKGVSIGTILEACQDTYGKCPVQVIGLQQGENMHETMDGKIFSNNVKQYTKDQFIRKFLCPTK